MFTGALVAVLSTVVSSQTDAVNPGLQGVLTRRDANSGLCFAALVVDANAQNTA